MLICDDYMNTCSIAYNIEWIAHIVEELRKLRQCPLDLLNVRMAFLHFTVRGPSLAITVRVHQGLAEDLTALIVVDDGLDLFRRCIRLD